MDLQVLLICYNGYKTNQENQSKVLKYNILTAKGK